MAITYKWTINQMNAHIQAEGEEPFTPYADTEAFEAVVIGWLESALNVPAMVVSIEAQIAKQITPVNEDLYFTWDNPPVPAPPAPTPPVEE